MKSSAQSLKIEEIEKNYIKELSNKYDQESNFLSVSICLRVKYWICPNRINDRERFLLKLFLKAEEMINNKMDVINFMKVNQEFNYVKSLLFDDVHSLCLSFFKKPKVLEKNIIKINYKSHKKLKEIIKHFTEKKDLSKKDETILNLLSDEVKNFIKKRMNQD